MTTPLAIGCAVAYWLIGLLHVAAVARWWPKRLDDPKDNKKWDVPFIWALTFLWPLMLLVSAPVFVARVVTGTR